MQGCSYGHEGQGWLRGPTTHVALGKAVLSLMLRFSHFEILDHVSTRTPAFLFCTGPTYSVAGPGWEPLGWHNHGGRGNVKRRPREKDF